MLLSSPSFSSYQLIGIDHSSRVVATMAESGSRKRESNGSGFPHPRGKLPRSSLPHSRNAPDTLGGLLVPPQLNGRLVHILFFFKFFLVNQIARHVKKRNVKMMLKLCRK